MSSIKNYVFDASQIQKVVLYFPEINKAVVVPKINNAEDEMNHPLSWRVPETGLVDGYGRDGNLSTFTPYSKYPDESINNLDCASLIPFEFLYGTLYIKCDASEYEEAKAAIE